MSRTLRRREVCALTGLSKSTLYARIKDDLFPKSIRLGPKARGWREEEVLAWLAQRPRSDEGPPGSFSLVATEQAVISSAPTVPETAPSSDEPNRHRKDRRRFHGGRAGTGP